MIKAFVLWLARTPSDPEPPAGSPESIRTFRAAPNFFYWNLVNWGALQCISFALLLAMLFLGYKIDPKLPQWGRVLSSAAQGLILTCFLLQSIVSGYKQKLDYEMRWYMVTDRSLRIRWGIFFVREVTMTFANIQRVSVNQGPLQKLLGIADVQVSTAGGGSSAGPHGQSSGMMDRHSALFEGVGNAQEIRDLILERLRRYRDAGLGDPDDEHHEHTEPEAALEVLAEVRRLGAAVSSLRARPSSETT